MHVHDTIGSYRRFAAAWRASLFVFVRIVAKLVFRVFVTHGTG